MEKLSRLSEYFDQLRPETLRTPNKDSFIKYPYGVPSGFYDQLWDWDAFFICQHLAQRPDNPQPDYFKHWVKNFVHAHHETGHPPGCITKDRPAKDRRNFSLKPFMAQAALEGSYDGFDWLEPHYETICEIVTRRETTNRDEKTGLYFWDDAMQSGIDNNAADSNLPDTRSLYLSCDLNSYQWKEYCALTEIATALGHSNDALKFETESKTIKAAMNTHLWNSKLGTYDNRRRDNGQFVNCISCSNYVPLWAGLASQDQASLMIDKYLLDEKHLMTQWGARSLSCQDRAYNNLNIIIPYSNWRGPIWPIANYFYHQGLLNYGYVSEARDLANRIASLLLDDLDQIGSMHENYCAETGKPLAPSVDQAPQFVEGGFIGWNLLSLDMLEDHS